MFVERFAELSVLLTLSIVPVPTLARESSDTTMPAIAQAFSESTAIFREIKLFANVQVPIRDAIAIAEKRTKGGKVVDVAFDGQADRLAYRVKTYQRHVIWEGTIDATTGTIIGEGVLTPVSTLDLKDRTQLAGFSRAGIDLSEAVSIAEEYQSGRAVSAGLEQENGKLIFLVVVVADDSLRQISVDPNESHNRLSNASVGKIK